MVPAKKTHNNNNLNLLQQFHSLDANEPAKKTTTGQNGFSSPTKDVHQQITK